MTSHLNWSRRIRSVVLFLAVVLVIALFAQALLFAVLVPVGMVR